MAACSYQRFIQKARRDLGLDEETYRQFLESVTGQRSTRGMSRQERWRVVEALKEKGVAFESKTGKGRKDASKDDSPQAKLARHLWLTLKSYGVLRDSSEWALLAFVKRTTGVARFEWLNKGQMDKVIESLKQWVDREEAKAPAAGG
jgi:phage gp16-like protein